MKKLCILLTIALTFALTGLVYFAFRDCSDMADASKSLPKQGASIKEVIDSYGKPENVCYQPGLMEEGQRAAFGLQWGIDKDPVVLPGNIQSAEITVWFDSSANVIEVN